VMAVVLVIVIVGGPFLLRGTGKLADRIQLVLTYSMTAVGFLLSMLTVFLSTSTLAGDLREKRIETIATKPIPRSQVLLGKWLAVMTLNVVLLGASAVVTYALVRLVIGPLSKAPNDTVRRQLVNEVYTARHTIEPLRPDEQIEAYIDQEIAHLRKAGELEEKTFDEAAYRRKRRKDLWVGYNTLPPGGDTGYRFENVRPASPEQNLFLRYKLVNIGPTDQPAGDNPRVVVVWTVIYGEGKQWMPPVASVVSLNQFHELAIPAYLVGPEGRLIVTCTNITNHPTSPVRNVYAAFTTDKGIALLYVAGTFEGNFVRAVLLVLARLAFLAALSLAAAALLTFPVASMFVVFIFLCSLLVDQFAAFSAPVAGTEDSPFYEVGSPVYRGLFKAMAALIPNLGRYDGTADLATGRLVSWGLVLRGLARIALIYGGVVMLLGCLYFRVRELEQVE